MQTKNTYQTLKGDKTFSRKGLCVLGEHRKTPMNYKKISFSLNPNGSTDASGNNK